MRSQKALDLNTIIISSVERQKGVTASQLYIYSLIMLPLIAGDICDLYRPYRIDAPVSVNLLAV